MARKFVRVLAAILICEVLFSSGDARGDRLLPRAGVVGAIGSAAYLASEAYGLIMSSAIGITAQTCGPDLCLENLNAFLARHRIAGRTIVQHELGRYADRHPEHQAAAAVIASRLRLRAPEQTLRPARSIPPPPGDCRAGDQNRMQELVDRLCKVQRSCSPGESRAVLAAKAQINQQCIAARERINRACFRGGDQDHREASQQAVRSLIQCQNHYARAAR